MWIMRSTGYWVLFNSVCPESRHIWPKDYLNVFWCPQKLAKFEKFWSKYELWIFWFLNETWKDLGPNETRKDLGPNETWKDPEPNETWKDLGPNETWKDLGLRALWMFTTYKERIILIGCLI